jgi:hypothetical protein
LDFQEQEDNENEKEDDELFVPWNETKRTSNVDNSAVKPPKKKQRTSSSVCFPVDIFVIKDIQFNSKKRKSFSVLWIRIP